MNSYLLLLVADALYAFYFAINKAYQKRSGSSFTSGLRFNIFLGLSVALIFAAASGFRIEWSPYSFFMAAAMAALTAGYTLVGFRIMSLSSMTLYTVVLMTGGMIVPYAFGLLFLREAFSVWQLFGLLIIAAAIVAMNLGSAKPSPRVVLCCCAVFFLNGGTSVVSKLHQISIAPIPSTDFVVWVNLAKALICAAVLPFFASKEQNGHLVRFSKELLPIPLAALLDGGAYYLLLIGAITLPAGVIYPIVTGGTIILSALSGRIFHKEKITKRNVLCLAACFAGLCMFL